MKFVFSEDFREIDFGKFSDLLVPLITGHGNDSQLKEIFEKLDSDQDQYLTEHDFEDLLRLIGRTESIEKIKTSFLLLTTKGKLHFQGESLLTSTISPSLSMIFFRFPRVCH